MNKFLKLIFAAIIVSCPLFILAEDVISKDEAGLHDPAGIKRMEGSVLVLGDSKTFDEFVIPTQKVEFDYGTQKFKEWTKIDLEGSRDTVFYRLPRDASTLEVARSYEEDLLASGFEVVFKGSAKDLDNGYGRFMNEVYGKMIGTKLMEYIMPSSDDFRYLALKKVESDGSSTYVAGLFAKISNSWGSRFANPGEVVSRLDVIKTKTLSKRLVIVKAEEMPNLLGTSGKVILYGVLFDFNKAEIKQESEDTLKEVAKYLETNPTTKLVVTGHTDNVGTFEFNRDLSQKRAEAVVNHLSSNYKIDKTRLIAFGASFSSPVGNNEDEAGREKNRRVELVKF